MSAVVGLMGLGGELSTLAEVVGLLDIAVDVVLRVGAERGLAQLMVAIGQEIGEIGVEEVDESVLRVAATGQRSALPNWLRPALVWQSRAQSKRLPQMPLVRWSLKAWPMWPLALPGWAQPKRQRVSRDL